MSSSWAEPRLTLTSGPVDFDRVSNSQGQEELGVGSAKSQKDEIRVPHGSQNGLIRSVTRSHTSTISFLHKSDKSARCKESGSMCNHFFSFSSSLLRLFATCRLASSHGVDRSITRGTRAGRLLSRPPSIVLYPHDDVVFIIGLGHPFSVPLLWLLPVITDQLENIPNDEIGICSAR